MTEKCILDPSRDCLGLEKARMLEKQVDATGRQDLLYTLQTMQAQTTNLNRFIAEGGTQ